VSRWWNEAVAAVADLTWHSVPALFFLTLVATILVALAWYFWPAWLPWNWNLRWGSRGGGRGDTSTGWRGRFRFGRLRWRWRLRRRRRRRDVEESLDLPPDQLPDLPAAVLALTADQLAEAGRYAEAIRERLRAMVRGLIERGVIPHSPGWTVTELARFAVRDRPELGPALHGGADLFSEVWYGLRPASAADDATMRQHAADLSRALARLPVVSETR
jgi:hypothetical protein